MLNMHTTNHCHRDAAAGRLRRLLLPLAVCSVLVSGQALGQVCGCAGNPNSLGDFDSSDSTTWPPGTTLAGNDLVMPLPDDGVLIFDSFVVNTRPNGSFAWLRFEPSGPLRRNAPVTLLVAGDMTIGPSGQINVNGVAGGRGDQGVNQALGGAGGPGGFRGGDGAFQAVDPAASPLGGYGFGPGGGAPGDSTLGSSGVGEDGQYVGSADLLPLLGGGGGGGGNSRDTTAGCGGGGGGGGGGALLIAADGTLRIEGSINAKGALGGLGSSTCASYGGDGAGGAIRLLASVIERPGSGVAVNAEGAGSAADGVIRIETLTDLVPVNATSPLAFRSGAPGPLVSPIVQRVGIVGVGGETVSLQNGLLLDDRPLGAFGAIDVALQAAGSVVVNVETAGVPAGTNVEVSAKARRGGNLITSLASLDVGNCDAGGVCQGATTLDLDAGTYLLEARATFTQ